MKDTTCTAGTAGAVPESLAKFFRHHPRLGLAFSGGTDSAYLLYAAKNCGCQVVAYYAKSRFQPDFELADAKKLAAQLGVTMKVLELDVLANPAVAANPADRCYHCKREIFSCILAAAAQDGISIVMDGTNASDPSGDRPGMRALAELSVVSPLRLCGITKAELRGYSHRAGLFTWNKPAYACLATRIPIGTAITATALAKLEAGEGWLMSQGFSDLRLRTFSGGAKLQLPENQLDRALQMRDNIIKELSPMFGEIVIDPEPRQPCREDTKDGSN